MTSLEDDNILLDTSVVSILSSPDSTKHLYYKEMLEGRNALISFQTLQESWFGAYNANWGLRRRRELREHLSRFGVVWPNRDLADISAEIRSRTRKVGRELAVADAWIAATAMMLGCPLAADNSDFSHVQDIIGLTLIRYTG